MGTDPLANVAGNFGLQLALPDTIMAAIKASDLQGPQAKAAGELRALAKKVDELMDGKTRSDTERVGRIVISAWYRIIQDDMLLPIDKKSSTYELDAIERRNP